VLRDHFIRKAIKGNCPRVNVIGTIWSLQTDSTMAFPVSAGSVAVGGGRHNGCTGILPPPEQSPGLGVQGSCFGVRVANAN